MAKMKTSSAAKKRFKVVGSGISMKIKRAKAYRRHLLTKKSTKRKRQLRSGAYISAVDFHHIRALLCNA